MKKVLFLGWLSVMASVVTAQDYENTKKFVLLNRFKEAREDLDKNMTNAKYAGKAEAFILKTVIYATLALEDATKNTPAGDQLTNDAYLAFKKYMSMDAAMSLINDPIYRDGPINVYNGLAVSGYNDYTKEKWDDAFAKMKKAVEISDILITKKIFAFPTDTTIVYLAGVTAQNSKNVDDALAYYKRLADIKLGGAEYENIYRYLVYNSFTKKDFTAFEKYKALGLELYPKSEYFTYDKIDFAYDIATNFEERIKAVEEVLAVEPGNYKGNLLMGQIIFDTLHPRKETDPLPSNAAELEVKMINAFNKAKTAKPDDLIAYLYLADHEYAKAYKLNEDRTKHAADMKTRTKPGTMGSKEDIAKRDLLDKQYGDALEAAREPYEKVAEIYAAKSTLDLRDKQQYKKIANYLADIYSYKKGQAKGKPAEQAKYAAEEKKWNDRYDSIK
jgi:hypothetical protein